MMSGITRNNGISAMPCPYTALQQNLFNKRIVMSASYALPPSSYFHNIVQAVQNLFAAVFVLKARDYAECFQSALAMSRVVGGSNTLSSSQLQELRVMAGVDYHAVK
jgi:hypothetical protein